MTSSSTSFFYPLAAITALTRRPPLHLSPRFSIVSPPSNLSPDLVIRRRRHRRSSSVVVAAQSNFFRVIQSVWKVGRDGIEAGTDLVPDFVPRPVARIGVAVVALSLVLFVLKSFLSAAFFVLD